MLIQARFTAKDQEYATQYHFTKEPITINQLKQLALEVIQNQFDQADNVKVIFYAVGSIEWQFLLSATTVTPGEFKFIEAEPEQCLEQAVIKTKTNYRYQQVRSWTLKNQWTNLQYINYQYWAIPPGQYIPIPIPLNNVNKAWTTEYTYEIMESSNLYNLKKISIIMVAVGSIWLTTMVVLTNKSSTNHKALEVIKYLLIAYMVVCLIVFILSLRKQNY